MTAFIRNLHVGGEVTDYALNGAARRVSTCTCQHCGFICDVPVGSYPEDVMGRCWYCWDSAKSGYPLGGLICRGRGPEDKSGGCVKLGFCPKHEAGLRAAIEKGAVIQQYFDR